MKLDGDDHFPAKEGIPSSWEGGTPMKWQSNANNQKPSIRKTILVAALVSLIIGALTTFTAFMVLSPRTFSPVVSLTVPSENNDHPGIPKEYVKEVLDYVFHKGPPPSNSTHHHEKRQLAVPDPPICKPGTKFITRRCDESRGTKAWEDICEDGKRRKWSVKSQCAIAGQICSEHIDGDRKRVVLCRDLESKLDATKTGSHKGWQYGYRLVSGTQKKDGDQYIKSIPVLLDLGTASISGYLSDDHANEFHKPRNALVAHIRGIDKYFYCKNIGDRASCSPSATQDLQTTDVIDFTFGLAYNTKDLVLFYSIWGWHG